MLINLKSYPIGVQLVIKRTLENVSQKELAAFLGISNTHLSCIERMRVPVPEKHIDAINNYLSTKIISEF